jgi:uncharacterized protein (DUF1330 family)
MKAYAVFLENVKDEETFATYRKEVIATIAAHGGRFLVRGGAFLGRRRRMASPEAGCHRVPFARGR